MGRESELFLTQLCLKSFLTLWCYANPFNDKGLNVRQEGKELCDLLVVFGNEVIIFSDKSCEIECKDPRIATRWRRWHAKAIHASVLQIRGAERWIRGFPERIYSDSRCTKPIPLPDRNDIRIHRVIVALGAEDACKNHFGHHSGSLPIASKPTSNGTSGIMFDAPFLIGGEGAKEEHFHIFDKTSLQLVMQQLDTVSDFLEYLSCKETFLERLAVIAPGEEELLAMFLKNSQNGHHCFIQGKEPLGITIADGGWKHLISTPQYKNGQRANQQSYAWDQLIEHFTSAWLKGETEGDVDRKRIEAPLRLMASNSRLKRRALGRLIAEVARVQRQDRRLKFLATSDFDNPKIIYAGVGIPYLEGMEHEEYRRKRQTTMLVFARSLKLRMPTLEQAVVIGIGESDEGIGSEDLALVDLTVWSDEIAADTQADMNQLGIGAEPTQFQEIEFPENTHGPDE